MYDFFIALAGVRVRVRARFPETVRYFREYAVSALTESASVGPEPHADVPAPVDGPDVPAAANAVRSAAVSGSAAPDVLQPSSLTADCRRGPVPILGDVAGLGDWEWNATTAAGMPVNAYTEYTVLTAFVSDALLEADRVIFHGVALRWRDRAWLITAPSGVGKSTQFKHLSALRPGEFSVICGDRPVLEFRPADAAATGGIWVHPSPWNGKESWQGAEPAPLGGIISLRRGEENSLKAVSPRDIALEIFPQFLQSCREAENIRRVAALETRMLEAVPLWRLTTFQVPDSTKLLLETVFPQ